MVSGDFGVVQDNPVIICDRSFNRRLSKSWYKWKVQIFEVFLRSPMKDRLIPRLFPSTRFVSLVMAMILVSMLRFDANKIVNTKNRQLPAHVHFVLGPPSHPALHTLPILADTYRPPILAEHQTLIHVHSKYTQPTCTF